MSLTTLCRVCAAVISNPTPAEINQQLGGLDLRLLAQFCAKCRVWEKPNERPGWVAIFGPLPAVSVDLIGIQRDHFQRCSLLITIAGLERRIGRLFKSPKCEPLFESQSGIKLRLVGFNSESLANAKVAADNAKLLKWTEERRLVVASGRFGGQRPSTLMAPTPNGILPGLCRLVLRVGFGTAETNGPIIREDSLGHMLHGFDLEEDYVGLLVECS